MRSRTVFQHTGVPGRSHVINRDSDDLPITVNDDNSKRRRSLWKQLTKRWYKSDYDPLCADFAPFSDFGVVKKRRSSIKVHLLISGVLTFLVMSFATLRLWFAMRYASYHDRRIFPLSVRIEGAKLSQIASRFDEPLDFPVLVPVVVSRVSRFLHPDSLDEKDALSDPDADYGLKLQLLEENVTRVIYHDVMDDLGKVHDYSVRDDDVDTYYAYDDDYVRDVYKTYDGDEMKGAGPCRRLNWHRYHFPNCNSFHEMDITVSIPEFVGNGAYRDVFTHKHHFLGESEQVIWKPLVWNDGAGFTFVSDKMKFDVVSLAKSAHPLVQSKDMFEFTRMDALVSERFTSNHQFVDVYGHCGVSMLSEYLSRGNIETHVIASGGFIKQADLHDEEELKPQNTFSAKTKLSLALQMAELIADLHEYPQGKIVHNDIQLAQFLFDSADRIKFNDFNRAEIMLFDEDKQEYCRYRNGPGSGNNRAPEEYFDKPLNEKIDVYSYGNGVYGLLTGLWPFYELDDDHVEEVQEKVRKGERPFLDPRYRNRSLEEGILVDIIDACWAYDPNERPDMQSVATKLRLAKHELDEPASKHH